MHSATLEGMSPWLSPDEHDAWRGLLAMTSRLDARLNQQLQESSGLSLTDYAVLVTLSEAAEGRLRSYEIAGSLGWEQSRLSHHVTRMQRRGLVDREECPTDRRGAFVVLTGAGRAAIEGAAPAHVETVRRLVFEDVSDEQVAQLTAFTSGVLRRLEPGAVEAGTLDASAS